VDREVIEDRGYSLVELAVVLVILIVLSSIFLKNLSNIHSGGSIETDCKSIHAFLQQSRMEAFSRKQALNIALSTNGTRLCETVQNKCIDLENPFAASGNITISNRGIYTSGNIHVANVSGNPTYSCIVLSATRARLGEWDGVSCNAK